MSIVDKFVEMQAKYLMKTQRDGLKTDADNKGNKPGKNEDSDEDEEEDDIYTFISPINGKPIRFDKRPNNINSELISYYSKSERLEHKEQNKMRQRYLVQMVQNSSMIDPSETSDHLCLQ